MAFLRDEQGRLIRKDGSLVERPVRRKGARKTTTPCGRVSHLRVDQILGGQGPLREEYERLVENPNTLLKELQAWFRERGHHVNLSAISRHRHRYTEQWRALRQAAKTAGEYCKIAEQHNPGTFMQAAQGHAEMLLMQDMFQLKEKDGRTAEQWQAWLKALGIAAASRKSIEQIRETLLQKAKEAEKLDPSEANQRVVERVRQILGV